MTIRKATTTDYLRIVRAIQNKRLDYFTPAHVASDIAANRCYVVEENGKAIASCSLVYDATYGYHAVKRLAIFRKENKGRHLTETIFAYMIENSGAAKIGCTPWVDNAPMRHIMDKMGFTLEYIFEKSGAFIQKAS